MLCKGCKKDKLSREFHFTNVSPVCQHPISYCMRCMLSHVEKNKHCPSCNGAIDMEEKSTKRNLEFMQQTLAQLFKVYEAPSQATLALRPSARGAVGPVIGDITVTIVTGENVTLPIRENMTVLMLKKEMHDLKKYELTKLSLNFKGMEMKNFGENGEPYALQDYGVQPGSNIHLMIRLYALPDDMERVMFALSWDYPESGKDYLDATCLLFQGKDFIEAHDYRQAQRKDHLKYHDAIVHYGDMMDDKDKRGVHILSVFLKKLPAEVTHIFFTLSAFLSPDISAFPKKSICFFDAANPKKALCDTDFVDRIDKQAVIMAYVKRKPSGQGWDVIQSGEKSHGNATYYKPLIKTISKCIKREV